MIDEIYTDALLAAAAYADWGLLGTLSEPDIKAELINERGFTEKQYEVMFDPQNPNRLYDVYQSPSVGYTETLNGFSATIFQSRQDSSDITVAFRGTDSLIDWGTNLEVLLEYDNAVVTYLGTQDDVISVFLERAGLVTDGVMQSGVNFTGHSLGGYLATMASYKYASTMGSATTFNGLGVSITDYISNEIFNATSLNGKLSNYYADIVGAIAGVHPGSKTKIFIEEDGPIDDHSISKLVESLSVYRILEALDSKLDNSSGLKTIYSILDASSNDPEQSLENIIVKLGDLLGGDFPTLTSDVELFYQELFNEGVLKPQYQNLTITSSLIVQDEVSYRYALVNLNPFVITGIDYSDHNKNGELELYDPVTDKGELTEKYIKARADVLNYKMIYDTEDMDYDDKYSPEGVQGNWDYIDKTTGIELVIDGGGITFSDHQIAFGSSGRDLLMGSGDTDQLFGGGNNDEMYGKDDDDYLEGNAGNDLMDGGDGKDTLLGGIGDDTLKGREGEDHLSGGAGADLLDGGTDRDLLIGGKGQDTLMGGDGIDILYGDHRYFDESIHEYVVEDDGVSDRLDGGLGDDLYYAGAGDVINDADGKGWIKMEVTFGDGRLGYVSLDVFQEKYKTEFTKFTKGLVLNYSYNETSKKLTVSQEGHPENWLVVENFTMGQFGIGVDWSNVDDFINNCYWLSFDTHGESKPVENCYLSYDPWWYQTTGTEEPDVIVVGDGDDEIIAAAGDDEVYAGPGDDVVYGGIGDDKLYGEGDSDQLYGGQGDDELYGGEGSDHLYGGQGDDQLRGGAGDGDILDGGLGNDTYIFSLGDGNTTINNADNSVGRRDVLKFLSGITPGDVTISRKDYDLILNIQTSGESISVTGYFWQEGTGGYALDAIQFDDGTSWDIATVLEMPLNGSEGDDTIYGDSGDDVINGHGGNDTLVGLEGNDTISGGEGDDQLFGFAGNDQLNGDAGNDYLDGAEGVDIIHGGIGEDTVFAGDGIGIYEERMAA